MKHERSLRFPIDLPGWGDTSPPDPDDIEPGGPYLCQRCGDRTPFPTCYCQRRTA